MNQQKLVNLIEHNWTTDGIRGLNQDQLMLWKEFSDDINIDAKAKQVANIFFNYIKSFISKQQYHESLQKRQVNALNDLDDVIFEQLSFLLTEIGNNFISNSNIKNNFGKIKCLFNFVWYGLVPIFFYKVFKNLLLIKQDFYDGLIDELSLQAYKKVINLEELSLNRLDPATKMMFMLVDNFIESLKKEH